MDREGRRTLRNIDGFSNYQKERSSSESYPYVPLPSIYDEDQVESKTGFTINATPVRFPWEAIILAFVYYVLTVLMPIFNDLLFQGYGHIIGFKYPLTATWLQLFGVTVLLAGGNVAVHMTQRKHVLTKSWIGGPKFWWKCKHLVLVSLTFGAVISLSNVGLFLIRDVNVHVLLRSSEIIWVVGFAMIIQREIPTMWTLICCGTIIAGTVLISLDFSQMAKPDFLALAINLASAVASGLMIVLLRRACVILKEADPTISVAEITLIKIGMATLFVLPPTLGLEWEAWKVLFHSHYDTQLLVVGGIFITMSYQSVVVGLTTYSLATTVGIIGQTKLIPQVALTILWTKKFNPTPLHITGVMLLISASIVYGFLRWKAYQRNLEEIQHNPKMSMVYNVDT